MLRLKIHKAYRRIVAVSDPELLGKRFAEDKLQLEIKEDFYGGELLEEERVLKILTAENADDSTFNFAGKKSVEAGRKAGIIGKGKKSVIIIQGIPHAISLL